MQNEPKPFDPEDTDWGRNVEARHQQNIARFARIDTKLDELDRHVAQDIALHRGLEARIAHVEGRMDKSEEDRKTLHQDVHRVLNDTSTLVNFSRAAAAFRRFLAWAVPVISAAITAYVTWQVKK